MDLNARCRPIELLLSDVDGVLTDGGVIFDNRGIEIKRFHIRDGLGIKLWQRGASVWHCDGARLAHRAIAGRGIRRGTGTPGRRR